MITNSVHYSKLIVKKWLVLLVVLLLSICVNITLLQPVIAAKTLPYATTIGLIGASNIDYAYEDGMLLEAFDPELTAVKGMPNMMGFRAAEWAEDTLYSDKYGIPKGTPIMTNAINTFKEKNVDVVMISVGHNDAREKCSPEDYKASMNKIVKTLQEAGFRQVVIHHLGYAKTTYYSGYKLIPEYNKVVTEVVIKSKKFALLGDEKSYDFFQKNQDRFRDEVHLTAEGYNELAKFWADAMKAGFKYQMKPMHGWNKSNRFPLGGKSGLVYAIDKYAGEFNGIVKVDDVQLDEINIASKSGGIEILLDSAFLNKLSLGKHKIRVEFKGAVVVKSTFVCIPAAPTKITITKTKSKVENKQNMKISWEKVQGQYYTVQISTKKSSGFRTIKKYTKNLAGYTKKDLKKGKRYYFRVKTYKVVGGIKYYSNYSVAKCKKM